MGYPIIRNRVELYHTSVSDLTPPSCSGVYKQEEQSESEREREAREQLNTFNSAALKKAAPTT
jgi:hypothetical protein